MSPNRPVRSGSLFAWAMLLAALGAPGCGAAAPKDALSPSDGAPTTLDAGAREPTNSDGAAAPHDARPFDESPPAAGDGGVQLTGCSGGFGSVGATFWGIPAYCQPSSAIGYYQCDELANRFLRDALHHPNLDNVVTEYASSMCAKAAARSEYSVWGPGYGSSSGRHPVEGDLIVWSGTPGHVAVVTGIDRASVSYVQQNRGAPTGTAGWNAATSFFTSSGLICWIHPEPSAPAPPPSGSDCGCFDGDGDYCGLSILNHEEWYGCVANVTGGAPSYSTLYTCTGGVFVAKSACTACITDYLTRSTGHCAN